MAHTDFSTIDHIAQWEDEDGIALVGDLAAPALVLADALGITDLIALDTLDAARDLLSAGVETWETINGDDDGEHYLWLVDLSEQDAPESVSA